MKFVLHRLRKVILKKVKRIMQLLDRRPLILVDRQQRLHMVRLQIFENEQLNFHSEQARPITTARGKKTTTSSSSVRKNITAVKEEDEDVIEEVNTRERFSILSRKRFFYLLNILSLCHRIDWIEDYYPLEEYFYLDLNLLLLLLRRRSLVLI